MRRERGAEGENLGQSWRQAWRRPACDARNLVNEEDGCEASRNAIERAAAAAVSAAANYAPSFGCFQIKAGKRERERRRSQLHILTSSAQASQVHADLSPTAHTLDKPAVSAAQVWNKTCSGATYAWHLPRWPKIVRKISNGHACSGIDWLQALPRLSRESGRQHATLTFCSNVALTKK